MIDAKPHISQQQIIYLTLKDAWPSWIVSYQLEKVDTKYGWLGTSALKRCRELEISGQIEKANGKTIGLDKKYIYYRWKEPILLDDLMGQAVQPEQQRIRI